MEMYSRIKTLDRCFVSSVTTKHLNFLGVPPNRVFLKTLKVFTTDRYDLYAVVQSTLHEVWVRKYSGALGATLRYSDCFETYPFPEGLWQTANPILVDIGKRYHEHRRALMLQLWLGLTDIYNLFHTRDLTPELVAKVSKKSLEEAEIGYLGILELRRLHRELDQAVLNAYGWDDPSTGSGQVLDLGHDFVEVETLPENDRVRYTLSPAARKEVLKQLLAENHRRAAEQAASTPAAKPKTKRIRKTQENDNQGDLFA